MEIIIEGRKVDTKDIWDITFESKSNYVCLIIKITDKPQIQISQSGLDSLYTCNRHNVVDRYERLYKSIKEKWEADKTELQIFKL